MTSRSPVRLVAAVVLGILVLTALGCSSAAPVTGGAGVGGSAPGTGVLGGPCPVASVRVVVSVDQWSDMVRQLGGQCTQVTTVLTNSAADPHEFEPSAGDVASFGGAQLVVVNGAGYDTWAAKSIDTLATRPPVVDAGAVVGAAEGANPHLWYSPADVDKVADALTSRLRGLAPGAASYFDERAAAWKVTLQPYRDAIAAVQQRSRGRAYGATESVYDLMTQIVGLRDVTPAGFRQAATNHSEAAPGDVHEFEQTLAGHGLNVLIFNTQTEGAIPQQLRDAARSAGVPVLDVTESAPANTSFVQWQVGQLRDLEAALGPPGA